MKARKAFESTRGWIAMGLAVALLIPIIGTVGALQATAAAAVQQPSRGGYGKELAAHLRGVESAFSTDDDGVVPVIASLRGASSVVGRAQKMRYFDGERRHLVDQLGRGSLRGLKELDGAPFVSMHVTRSQFDHLRSLPEIADVVVDGVSTVDKTTYFGGADGQQLPQGWDIPRIGADWTNTNGWTGTGMKIAVIDSGVDSQNPYLAGKVVNEACFATNKNGTGACANGSRTQYSAAPSGVVGSARWTGCTFEYYNCSHGTHVAQTAAGYSGVASLAKIVAIRAGHKERVGSSYEVLFSDSDILASLWYVDVILPKSNIVVAAVNLSIGDGVIHSKTCDAHSPAVTSYVRRLRSDHQIPTVIAAGNDNSKVGVNWPACIAAAVVVGNTTLTAAHGGADAVFAGGSGGSNSSPLVDLLAPGTDICSAVPTWLDKDGWDCEWSGTSMAAPHVAGAIAVLTQKRPLATVTQLVTALQKSGLSGGQAVTDSRNRVKRTRINIANAVYYNI